MPAFLSQLVNWLLYLFGARSSAQAINMAEAVVTQAIAAFLKNIAEIGVQDGARFLAAARELSAQINAKEISGPEKLKLYLGSVDELLLELGGDIAHTLATSVKRTAAELFHQPDAGSKGGAS